MRLSELTNEMLSTYKYPNLMAEVKESTYSICTIAEHIGLGRYRKEDDSKVWSKLTGREEILYDEALGLARLFMKHSRGCKVEECTRYEKGARMKRKDVEE